MFNMYNTKTVDDVVGKLQGILTNLVEVAVHQSKIVEEQQELMDTAQVARNEANEERGRADRIAGKLQELLS